MAPGRRALDRLTARGWRGPLARLARDPERALERQIRRIKARLQSHTGSRPAPNAVALIAVESVLRPRIVRLVEYAAWAALSAMRSPRVLSLSVGPAQIQLRYWHKLGLLDGTGFTPRRLRHVARLGANYDACRVFLDDAGVLETADPAKLAAAYTGGRRPRYPALLATALRHAAA